MNLKHITFFCLGGSLLLGLFTACSKSGVKPNNADSTKVVVHIKGWQQVASLPSPRAYASAFTLNGNGYVAGGISDMGDPHAPGYDDMYMYDAIANKWIKKAGMPALDIAKGGRQYPFTFMINDTIYGGGGVSLNGMPGNDVNAYDPVKDQWKLVAKLNGINAFDQSSGVEIKNKGYIFSLASGHATVYEFEPTSKTVIEAPFASYFTSYLSGPWAENSWYGTDGTDLLTCYTVVQKIDTVTHLFSGYTGENQPNLPFQHSILIKGLYYKGNMYSVYGNAGDLYRFNLVKGTYEPLAFQNLGVTEGVFAFIADGKLYVAGGNNGIFTPSTDKVWMIDLDAYPQ